MVSRTSIGCRVLFNDDGFCTYSTASPYQSIDSPVCMEQVYGYVDEVADAGCDTFMLCPNIYQLPGWDSDHYPFWKGEGRTVEMPDTVVGKVVSRVRDFILAGNDLISLSQKRAKDKGVDFFISWRMNESHGLADPAQPWVSDFYRMHPEYRIGDSYSPPYWNAGLALSFLHEEVRNYQFGFIDELCKRYEFDGLELDFLRWPYFFPKQVPFAERSRILTDFIRRIRNTLDMLGKDDVPICIRVHNIFDYVLEMGLDIRRCVDEGLVDMINVSPFYITSSESEIETFRKHLPTVKIYAELTQCTAMGKSIELSTEETRKSTTEILRSAAYNYLEQGADGISLFNFVYYRDYSFRNPEKRDRCEPNYTALKGIADRAMLSEEAKHYFISKSNFEGQLPIEIKKHRRARLSLYVADEMENTETRTMFRRNAILRFQTETSRKSNMISVFLHGRLLQEVFIEGELFPNPYQECIPVDHSCYADFEVPVSLLEKGWNKFLIHLDKEDIITIQRMELAIYKA